MMNTPELEHGCAMRNVTRDLLESIAMEEMAMSRILDAESRKMDRAMALEGLDLCKLLEVNDSATNMVHAIANLELVLKEKMELVMSCFCAEGTEPAAL